MGSRLGLVLERREGLRLPVIISLLSFNHHKLPAWVGWTSIDP